VAGVPRQRGLVVGDAEVADGVGVDGQRVIAAARFELLPVAAEQHRLDLAAADL